MTSRLIPTSTQVYQNHGLDSDVLDYYLIKAVKGIGVRLGLVDCGASWPSNQSVKKLRVANCIDRQRSPYFMFNITTAIRNNLSTFR